MYHFISLYQVFSKIYFDQQDFIKIVRLFLDAVSNNINIKWPYWLLILLKTSDMVYKRSMIVEPITNEVFEAELLVEF